MKICDSWLPAAILMVSMRFVNVGEQLQSIDGPRRGRSKRRDTCSSASLHDQQEVQGLAMQTECDQQGTNAVSYSTLTSFNC